MQYKQKIYLKSKSKFNWLINYKNKYITKIADILES